MLRWRIRTVGRGLTHVGLLAHAQLHSRSLRVGFAAQPSLRFEFWGRGRSTAVQNRETRLPSTPVGVSSDPSVLSLLAPCPCFYLSPSASLSRLPLLSLLRGTLPSRSGEGGLCYEPFSIGTHFFFRGLAPRCRRSLAASTHPFALARSPSTAKMAPSLSAVCTVLCLGTRCVFQQYNRAYLL